MDSRVYEGINDLKTTNPILAKQWHPTRNGELLPTKVTAGSHQKVWWYLPYDDPKTGKHFEFEWIAEIRERNKGMGCPYISGKAVWKGYNDLETLYPDLSKQWHPTKNKGLKDKKGTDISTPDKISAGSRQKVWWYLPYDDPRTGKHFDFEWEAVVSHRTIEGSKCPYLTGNKLLSGFNDLATTNPELAAQWHPVKNGNLTPRDVSDNSNKKVWWYISANDPTNNEGKDLEWEETPNHRSLKGIYNYYRITKKRTVKREKEKVIKQKKDSLALTHPEIAKEWHPTKNGKLRPQDVTAGSTRRVWWYQPYDDPRTGKHFDFEWQNSILNRVRGNACPYLAHNPKVWEGYNDLATTNPELAAQWHPTKNGDLRPNQVTAKGYKKIWWYQPYDDPRTGKHFDFEWEATLEHRVKYGRSCPYLTNQMIMKGYNDLATVNPELAKQWNYDKNGKQKPDEVAADSNKKVWWICKKGHEWNSSIHTRNIGIGCPICSSELRTSLYEYIIYYYIKQLDSTVLHSYKEQGFELDIYIPSKRTAIEYDGEYWHKGKQNRDKKKNLLCKKNGITLYRFRENGLACLNDTSIDILTTNKSFKEDLKNLLFEIYGERIDIDIERDKSNIDSLRTLMDKEDSLAIKNPLLAAQWHPTKNGKLKPEHISTGSEQKVWWYLPYDDPRTGKHFDFEWKASVGSRNSGVGCPFLSGNAIWPGFNDLTSRNPEIAEEWHPTKNGNLEPGHVTAQSGRKVWWKCEYGHEWQAVISNRTKGSGCPFCYKERSNKQRNNPI